MFNLMRQILNDIAEVQHIRLPRKRADLDRIELWAYEKEPQFVKHDTSLRLRSAKHFGFTFVRGS